MKLLKSLCCILGLGAMMLVAGCADEPVLTIDQDDAVLGLRLDEVFQEKAYVRLTHNGGSDDYWYYMVTEDLTSDAEMLLSQVIAQDLEADGEIVGNIGVNKNITIENLSAKTDYRVLASRISSSGEMYGNVAELVFVTMRDPAVFEVYSAWKIEYKERRAAKNNPDEESDIFDCTVAGDDISETYVPCLIDKKDFESAYGSDIRKCFEDYIAYRNLANAKWPNEVRSGNSEFVQDRLRHGDYILFMIGVDSTGELTGYYAKTDCRIEQEQATDAYRKWIGKWTVVGKYGNQEIRYPVEIIPDENNLYYRMTGWESTSASDYFEPLPTERPILLYFEKSTGFVYVISEELQDYDDQVLAEFYDFFVYGCVEIMYGGELTQVPVDIPNLRIARFALADDNHALATPEIFSFDLNGEHYDAPFIYFNYSYTSVLYQGLVPVTTDSVVPRIDTMRLER